MATVAYIQVGKLQKSHGLKGEIQASIDLYDPDILSEATVLFVEVKNAYAPYFVENIKINGNKAIILFDEMKDVNQANTLRGLALYVSTEHFPAIQEDESWQYDDIIGFTIIDQVHGKLGIIEDVFETTGQDLIAMTYKEKEVLIPIVEQIILKVNKKSKSLEVRLPDGLLELYIQA
ncbi:MAG: rRNA processing protein RimM [Bacteroidota bacterium]